VYIATLIGINEVWPRSDDWSPDMTVDLRTVYKGRRIKVVDKMKKYDNV
jgi:hypothetical protein